MNVALVRVLADGRTRELALRTGQTIVGRGDGCHVRVPVSKVSRKHCELTVSQDSGVSVKDLGSSNGTFVNQERVKHRALAAGDLLSFGGMVFVVRVNGQPADIDPEACFEDGLPEAEAVSAPSTVSAPGRPVPKDADDSSMADFEFDFSDDDDQPKL